MGTWWLGREACTYIWGRVFVNRAIDPCCSDMALVSVCRGPRDVALLGSIQMDPGQSAWCLRMATHSTALLLLLAGCLAGGGVVCVYTYIHPLLACGSLSPSLPPHYITTNIWPAIPSETQVEWQYLVLNYQAWTHLFSRVYIPGSQWTLNTFWKFLIRGMQTSRYKPRCYQIFLMNL